MKSAQVPPLRGAVTEPGGHPGEGHPVCKPPPRVGTKTPREGEPGRSGEQKLQIYWIGERSTSRRPGRAPWGREPSPRPQSFHRHGRTCPRPAGDSAGIGDAETQSLNRKPRSGRNHGSFRAETAGEAESCQAAWAPFNLRSHSPGSLREPFLVSEGLPVAA